MQPDEATLRKSYDICVFPTSHAAFRFPQGKQRGTLTTTSTAPSRKQPFLFIKTMALLNIEAQMTITIISMRQSFMLSLTDFVLGKNLHPAPCYSSRAGSSATLLLKLYFARGVVLYCLGEYKAAIRDLRMVLRMDWRHRGAAAWIAKAEHANRRSAQGKCR